MSVRECSECGVSAAGFIWGFVLLVRDGWAIVSNSNSNSPNTTERSWLCSECGSRAESMARGLARMFAPKAPRPPAANPQPLRRFPSVASRPNAAATERTDQAPPQRKSSSGSQY